MQISVNKITANLIDLVNFYFVFFPILIYFIPFSSITVKIMFLISALISLSWIFFNNKCIITIVSQTLRHGKTLKKGFSETYLSFFYHTIMKIFHLPNNKKGFNQAINIHWIFNLIIMWYYLFFYKCNC